MSDVGLALQQEQSQRQQQRQQRQIPSIAEYAHVYFSDERDASPYDGEASLSVYPRALSRKPRFSDRINSLSPPPSSPPSPSPSPSPDEYVDFEQKDA
jgi:hypothetical protein